MITTRPAALKHFSYFKVDGMEWKIAEAQRELSPILKTEERQLVERINLLRKPESEERDRQLTKVEAEIISTQSMKLRLQDHIADLKERLPVVLAQAKQYEKDLIATLEVVEKQKMELTGIDKELTKSLKEPMKLIKQRTEAVQHLAETKSQVSHLIGELHWNDPLKDEVLPASPEVLTKLQELLPRPLVVRFRG